MLVSEEMKNQRTNFRHKLNQRERVHAHAPNSNVSLIARIRGFVSPQELGEIIQKMQQRHPILNARVQIQGRDIFLVAEKQLAIPVKHIDRLNDDQWRDVILEEHKIPFEMTQGPLIRFILLSTDDLADLIIFSQHIICDGMSLAYLARDIMQYLGDSSKPVELLPPAPLVKESNIPSEIKASFLMRILGKVIKKKWEKDEVLFDYEDFKEFHKAFWKNYEYHSHLYEFSKEDTKILVQACRQHNVTVNTALIAAFAMAQNIFQSQSQSSTSKSLKYLEKFAFAVDLRKLLISPVEEQFGFFAGGTQVQYKYSKNHTLWEAAKIIHKNSDPVKARKEALVATLNNFRLPPTMMEAQIYAAFGGLFPQNSPKYNKMQAFIHNDNIVVKMVKKRLSEGLGLAQIMTNLGKLDFPEQYGDYKLENLILMPSCSPYTELVLGVVTQGGTLSITLNHIESTISTENVLKIKEIAHELLTKAKDS